MFRQVIDFAAYLAVRAFIACIQAASLERCDYFCRQAARLLADHLPIRRKLIDENLTLIFPNWSLEKIRDTRFQMWHHLLLMICEIAHAKRKIHLSNWHDHFCIPDRRGLLKIIYDQRPKILVTGHYGNFELAGYVTGLFGIQTTTIARTLDNPFLHRYITQFRSSGGQHMLDKAGSAGPVQDLLERGEALTLLADQHAGDRGVWVDFLGVPASCHKALALFTLQSNAPMAIIANTRVGGPLKFRLDVLGTALPESDAEHLQGVRQLTTWYNEALSRPILAQPEQYWWLHRRWRPKSKPARRAKPQQATDSAKAA